MANEPKRLHRRRFTLLAIAIAFATVGAVGAASTDWLVERGFTAALDRTATTPSQRKGAQSSIAGSEDFWLSAAGRGDGASAGVILSSLPGPVRIGAKVALAIDGGTRVFEVASLDELPAGVTRIGTAAASGLAIVTLRESGNPEGAVLRLVGELAGTSKLRQAVGSSRPL